MKALPALRGLSLASLMRWQAQFLTPSGTRKLAWGLMHDQADEVICQRDGLVWRIDMRDVEIGQALFTLGSFQAAQLAALLSWAEAAGRFNTQSVVIDIGANIGVTTLPLARRTACRVIAIEPVSKLADLLRWHLDANRLERVTVVERAISADGQPTSMLVPLINPGGAEIWRPEAMAENPILTLAHQTVQVETTRLDNLLDTLGVSPTEVALVWCDVQGSEGAVIQTGVPLWTAGVPLYIEIAPLLLRRQGGPEPFMALTKQYFDAFILADDLVRDVPSATPHAIGELATLIQSLETANLETDVLLLPRPPANTTAYPASVSVPHTKPHPLC